MDKNTEILYSILEELRKLNLQLNKVMNQPLTFDVDTKLVAKDLTNALNRAKVNNS